MSHETISLASTGFELVPKGTRKREFLEDMNLVVPWSELVGLVELYSSTGRTGRPPFAIVTMLRIHFMQQWFGLSDPAMEESLHDIPPYREFAQLDACASRLPDEVEVPAAEAEANYWRQLVVSNASDEIRT